MKKAKKTKITYTSHVEYVSSYKCPHCHTNIIGAQVHKHVTRFLCHHCKEEVIVDRDNG